MKEIVFEVSKEQVDGEDGLQVRAQTPLGDIETDELILIAARCIRQVGEQHGLDRAFDMLNAGVYQSKLVP